MKLSNQPRIVWADILVFKNNIIHSNIYVTLNIIVFPLILSVTEAHVSEQPSVRVLRRSGGNMDASCV